jgi:MFS family permease
VKLPLFHIKDFTGLLNTYSRRLVIGNLINSVGNGLTMSLFMVYLTTVRDFSMTFSGFALAWMAVVGLILNPIVGSAIDNFGARLVVIIGLIIRSIGTFGLAIVDTRTSVVFVATLMAIGDAGIWPGQITALTRITDEAHRPKIFAFNFMMLNLGYGLGGILSALIVQAKNLPSFQTLYRVDGATFLIYLILMLSLPSFVGKRENHHEAPTGSYAQVFKIKELLQLTSANLLLVSFGYSAAIAGLPIFIVEVLDISPKWLGIIWAANTVTIVLFQPAIARWLETTDKLKALRWVGVIWAISWVFAGVSGWTSIVWIIPLQLISSVIFAFGEMIWSPTTPSLVNQLSPDEIRGRANSLIALQWSVAGIIGPIFVGLMLNAGHPAIWVLVTTLGCLLPIPILRSIKIK